MTSPLVLPWFRAEPWLIPLPLAWPSELRIQPFGVMAAVAIIVGSHFAMQRGRQLDLHDTDLADFLTWTTSFGLVGAYLLNAVFYHPAELWAALSSPTALVSHYWGLSSYGGFLAGTLAAAWFSRRRGVSLHALADVWCYAIVFAWVFARGGCFLVHDHPGVPSDFALAVANYAGAGVARHDLGLYEALWSLALAPVYAVMARRGARVGAFAAATPLLYGPFRFGLDFLRAGPLEGGDVRYAGLTPAQYMSLALTLVGVVLMSRCMRRAHRPQPWIV